MAAIYSRWIPLSLILPISSVILLIFSSLVIGPSFRCTAPFFDVPTLYEHPFALYSEFSCTLLSGASAIYPLHNIIQPAEHLQAANGAHLLADPVLQLLDFVGLFGISQKFLAHSFALPSLLCYHITTTSLLFLFPFNKGGCPASYLPLMLYLLGLSVCFVLQHWCTTQPCPLAIGNILRNYEFDL